MEQLDLMALLERPAPPTPVVAVPEPKPSSVDHFFHMRCQGREIVEVDPKRLEWPSGDIGRSYSAQALAEKGAVKSPFRFRGAEWVNTGGSFHGSRGFLECYRIVPVEAFDGPSARYGEHDWAVAREERRGGYHGMSAKQGSRDIVLQGPPIIFVQGQPDQSALL
jgi:hypothetical protein